MWLDTQTRRELVYLVYPACFHARRFRARLAAPARRRDHQSGSPGIPALVWWQRSDLHARLSSPHADVSQ